MKHSVTILLLVCMLLSGCGTARKAGPGRSPSQRYEYRTGQADPESGKEGTEITSLQGHELIAYARKFLGTPYRYGANGPDHFDCSGYTTYVYKHFGIQLPRISRDQFTVGKPVRHISRLQPGDLVFFARDGKIFHVGMAVEVRDGFFTFIHASNAGVIISRSDETYWKPVYFGAKRMFD